MRRPARIFILAGYPRWIFFGRSAMLDLAYQLCRFSGVLTNRRVWRYGPRSTNCRRTEIGRAHGLNSSHVEISYAVFCLKKKKKTDNLLFLKKKKHKRKAITTT